MKNITIISLLVNVLLISCSGNPKDGDRNACNNCGNVQKENENLCHECGCYYLYDGNDSLDGGNASLDSGNTSIDFERRYKSDSDFPWEGTYINIQNWNNGYIVETRLTLKVDSTFELYMEYRGTSEPNIYRKSGKFRIDINNVVDLYGLVSKDRLYETFYNIKSDNIITNSTGRKELKKSFSNQLTNDKWDLYSLEEKKVGAAHPRRLESPYIKFRNDGIVYGQARYNNFSGHFEVDEDGFVTISNFIVTKMASLEPEVEGKYVDILSQEFRYAIRQDTLEFMDGDDRILAKFIRHLKTNNE